MKENCSRVRCNKKGRLIRRPLVFLAGVARLRVALVQIGDRFLDHFVLLLGKVMIGPFDGAHINFDAFLGIQLVGKLVDRGQRNVGIVRPVDHDPG